MVAQENINIVLNCCYVKTSIDICGKHVIYDVCYLKNVVISENFHFHHVLLIPRGRRGAVEWLPEIKWLRVRATPEALRCVRE